MRSFVLLEIRAFAKCCQIHVCTGPPVLASYGSMKGANRHTSMCPSQMCRTEMWRRPIWGIRHKKRRLVALQSLCSVTSSRSWLRMPCWLHKFRLDLLPCHSPLAWLRHRWYLSAQL